MSAHAAHSWHAVPSADRCPLRDPTLAPVSTPGLMCKGLSFLSQICVAGGGYHGTVTSACYALPQPCTSYGFVFLFCLFGLVWFLVFFVGFAF